MPAACAAGQRIGHLHRVFQRLRHAQPALGNQIHQRLAADELHHHEFRIAFGNDVVDGDDVGMIQRGSGLRFLNESAPALRFAGVGDRQYLDGDEAFKTQVLGLINLAHSARAQLLEKLIVSDDLAIHSSQEHIQFVTLRAGSGSDPGAVTFSAG